MFQDLIILIIGLSGLVFGAKLLVNGSINIAYHYQLPALWVGTVLVGFATTLPEIIVSVIAVLQGHPHISLGNALGSYIANIGMVLGITAIIQPLKVSKKLLKRELPLLTITLALLFILITDFNLSIQDGCILILGLLAFLWLITKNSDMLEGIGEQQQLQQMTLRKSYAMFIIGAIILWLSGEFIIHSAANIAKLLGMSEWVIGLTVVAIGTSLPELAASIISAKHGHHDLAIGNVIGSNILSILGVVAIPSILAPGQIPKTVIYYDINAMAILTGILWMVAIQNKQTKVIISRRSGAVILLCFLCYIIISLKSQYYP